MKLTDVDPITTELIRNGLQAVVDEMALTLVRTAYSANLKNAMDLSSALCDPNGRLIAQGLTLPLHLGSIPDAMAALLARFGNSMDPGDVFLLNDPYEGGTHLPDFFVFQPVYASGALLGVAVTVAHHTDVGGSVAGGNGYTATEIYQEGLRIPVMRLAVGGQLDDDFIRLLTANVRIPTKVLGDLRAQLAACHLGERGLLELAERYGASTLATAFNDLLDYSERVARSDIARLPDGRYEFVDFLDDDGIDSGPVRIQVAVSVQGDEMVVDFEGTSPQVKGAINSVLSFTKSAVYACVRCLMPRSMPNNEGYFRPIRVLAPAGTVVNPLPPASVAARGLTAFRIANAVMGALAQLAPDKIPACEVGGDTGISMGGTDKQLRPFVFLEFLFGGWGGRPFADGIDGVASIVVNFSNYPAEVIEREYPIRIEECGFVADTGGPGLHRGGLAMVRQYRFLEAGTVQIRTDRRSHPPYGLAGGAHGKSALEVLNPGAGERSLSGKTTLSVKRGDVLRVQLAGAGGWGDPSMRDPQAVLEDVLDEKVSLAHANDAYGVIVDPLLLTLDAQATAELRELRRGHTSSSTRPPDQAAGRGPS